jgi:hypothetical protein
MRPKDMTDEELAALPVGPSVRRERPITPEDVARGMHGRCVVWYEVPAMMAEAIQPDDIFAWADSEGRRWDFGRWADGRWFKQISVFA